jgi:putative transcription factor
MQCEMCGKDTELFLAVIEGSQLKTCEKCGKFGKIISRIRPAQQKQSAAKPLITEELSMERVVPDYAQRIRAEREKQKLTQDEFAKKIMVKASVLHKIETGQYEPPIDTARKLEKILHITLVEQRTEGEAVPVSKGKTQGLTIGDIIKIKR